MSRSGYSDDLDNWALIMWRGRVASATRGKRGQKLLRDVLAALDAMPVKELAAETFEADGQFCTLGALAHQRGMNTDLLNNAGEDCDTDLIGKQFDIAAPLAAEIMFMNDDWRGETPAHRWSRMRAWIASQIRGGAERRSPNNPEAPTQDDNDE